MKKPSDDAILNRIILPKGGINTIKSIFKIPVLTYSLFSLGLALLLSFNWITVSSAQDSADHIRKVRSVETNELGINNPVGLAFSLKANAFHVLETHRPTFPPFGHTDIFMITAVEDRKGSARIVASITDPINATFDNNFNRLLIFQPNANKLILVNALPDGSLDPSSLYRFDARYFDLQEPQGMAVDPESGQLFILDSTVHQIVSIEPATDGSFEGARISKIDLQLESSSILQGLAFEPISGNLHVMNPAEQALYEITTGGQIVGSRDLSPFNLDDPQAMVFAPSADLTDDPAQQNLYIADSGLVTQETLGATSAESSPELLAGKKTQQNPGEITEFSFLEGISAESASFISSLVRTIDTSSYNPPSPDPSGLAYLPSSDTLLMCDGEVEETVSNITHFEGVNVWETTLSGDVINTANISKIAPTVVPMANEPTGVAWNPVNGHFFFSDDSAREVFDLNPGPDGQIGTDDDTWTSFDTVVVGSNDPEGVAYDSWHDRIFVADGVNVEIYQFTVEGTLVDQFDVSSYGVVDPESVEFNSQSGTLFILSNSGNPVVIETTTDGTLLQTIDVSATNARSPAGLAYAPASDQSGNTHFYIVDRGIDNNSDPDIIDGKMFEITAPPPSTPGNAPPVVDAGLDQSITLPDIAFLDGIISDDGLPDPPGTVTSTWSQVSGPGTVTFADASVEDTTASFSVAGSYVLKLTADDGELTPSDEVIITVGGDPSILVLDIRVAASTDDAEENSSGSMRLTSSDLELVFDGSDQVIGMRFNGFDIPQGSTISQAFVQFKVDEENSEDTFLVIQGEDVDNSLTFSSLNSNISSRPRTSASESWNPTPWLIRGEAGPAQQTPDISAVIQEIIDRPGWASGNSLAIIITGTGHRTAESYDGDQTGAPLLHVEYTTDGGNSAPIATLDAYMTDEDTQLNVPASGVLDNDSDPDGDSLLAVLGTPPSNGTLALNDDGSFEYTPNPNFNGTDSFTYVANDGLADSNVVMVTITVNAVNDPPVADANGPYAGSVGFPVQFDGAGSSDVDGTIASYGWDFDDGTSGTGVNPTHSYSTDGTYTVVLTVTDDSGATAFDTTSAIIQTEPNNPPIAADNSFSTDEDIQLNVPAPGVLDNDSDPDGNGLTAILSTPPSNGTLALNNDGSFEYTPDPNFNGTDSFTYVANDGLVDSNVAIVTITVNAVNDPPVATDDSGTVTKGGTLNQAAPGILDNDSDPENDPLTVTTTPVTPPTNGSLTLNSDGSYTYTHDGSETTSDNFVYEVCDTEPLCDTATVLITIQSSVPQAIEVRVSSSSDDAEESSSGSVDLNSSDLELVLESSIQTVGMRFNGISIPQGATISSAYIQFQVDETNNVDPSTLYIGGEKVPNASTFTTTTNDISNRTPTNASVEWSPNQWTSVGVTGPDQQTPIIASVIQEIVDQPGWTDGNSLVIIITGEGKRVAEAFDGVQSGAPLLHVEFTSGPPNNPPTALEDTGSVAEGGILNQAAPGILDNDSDPNSDPLTVSTTPVTSPTNGSLTLGTDGSYTYTHNGSETTADSFVYEVCDSGSLCDTTTVSITITPVNDPPVANAGGPYSGVVGVSLQFDASGSSDVDGTITTYAWDFGDGNIGTGVNPTHSYATTGTYTVVLTVTDDSGATAVDTTSAIIQTEPNNPPIATENDYSTDEDIQLNVPAPGVLDNDNDPDGDGLSAIPVTPPSNGTFVLNSDGSFQYTPDLNFNGSDSFTYVANDGLADSNLATVSINVNAINDPPLADANGPYAGSVDFPVQFDGSASSDVDGTITSFSWDFGDGTNGTGVNPTHNYSVDGTYTVILTVTDDGGASTIDTTSANIVTEPNLTPSVNVGPDQTITLADSVFLEGLVSDDGFPNPQGALTAIWSQQSGPGTVTFSNNSEFLTTATFSATGTYVLRLSVSDGQLNGSDDLTVTVNAAPPNTILIPQDYSSIQAGMDAAQNGDLVLVSPGTYSENINVAKTITLASTFYTTSNESLIDQTIISSPDSNLETIIVSSSAGPETKIIGFTISNGSDGIKIRGKVKVLNNHLIDQVSDAVDFSSDAAGLVQDNIIENNGDDAVDIDDASVLIEGNQMLANGEGVEIRASNHSGPQLTIIIRNNTITDSVKTGLQLIDTDTIADTAALLVIDRNLITNSAHSGLSLMDNSVTSDDFRAASLLERILLFNNTFVGNQYGAHGGDNLIAINNIFVNHLNIAVKEIDGNSLLSHNLFWNNGTDNQGSNLDVGTTLFADPLLDPDYQLQVGSPAIDAGTALFTLPSGETVLDMAPGDYFGTAPDLGAYESNFGSSGNFPPAVDAGPDQTITLPTLSVNLVGIVSDDGNPDPPGTTTSTWSQVSGTPGVVFGNPNALETSATFPGAGVYILRLTADDSEFTNSDDIVITVIDSFTGSVDSRVAASTDDAEESSSGSVGLTSSDLELVLESSIQTVGMRFNNITIPQGSTISNAYIQFQADEANSEPTTLSIQGQAESNALTFTSISGNISNRARTVATVSWNPEPWTIKGEAGPIQQTPDITLVIQEIVNQPGWSDGNSLVVIVTGTGKRVAESYDGDQSGAPLLHVEFTTDIPTVSIVSPGNGATFNEGYPVSFSGSASDVQDGDLTSGLIWTSDLNGEIGTGGSFNRSDLMTGTHTITATAVDSSGKSDSESIIITVFPNTNVLVGAGDIAGCSYVEDEETAKLLDNIPGSVFTLGDNAYPDGSDNDFNNCYDPTWGRHKARTHPSAGNHEYYTAGASGYFNYFGDAAGEVSKGYYSYDVGDWHIIVLNSQCSEVGGCDINSPQGQWLQADLAANPSTCTLAYWHKPLFTSYSVYSNNLSMQDFWSSLYQAGTDVILNGHAHNYERFAPQDPNGIADSEQGIRQFVVGSGGAGLYPFDTIQPNSEVRESTTHGIIKLTLHPTSYDWEFIPIAGQTFSDSGSANCVSPPVPNDPPLAGDDGYTTDEDIPLNIAAPGTLGNDSDPDGNGLTAILSTPPSNGTLALNNDGSFDYTPDLNFNGTDSFTYVANDGLVNSNLATVTITVNAVNDPPLADANGPYAGSVDIPVQFDGSASSDVDGTIASYEWVFGDGTNGTGVNTSHSYSAVGTYTIELTVTDDGGTTAIDTTSAVIQTEPNQAPVAGDDGYATDEDVQLNVTAPGVLGSDIDPDGDGLTALLGTPPSNGTLVLNVDGSFDYTPDLNFNGTDSFTYVANDGLADSNVATVTITVNAVNDPPVAVDDGYTTNEGVQLNVAAPGVLGNDSDPDGDGLTAVINTQPSNGTLALNNDGSFDYTPDLNFNGTDSFTYVANDSLEDSNVATVTITVNPSAPITVEARVAASSDDAEEIASGRVSLTSSDLELVFDKEIQTVGIRFNGLAIPKGATIIKAYIQFQVDETTTEVTALTIQGQADDNAPTFVNTSGNISSRATTAEVPWTPDPWTSRGEAGLDQQTPNIASIVQEIVSRPGWSNGNSMVFIINGTGKRVAESFNGDQAGAPLLHVEYDTGPPNAPPTAIGDNTTMNEDTLVTIEVAINDSDPDGNLDPTSTNTDCASCTNPFNGNLTNNGDGSFEYTPNPNFNGIDSFVYEICDTRNACDTALVNISVDPVADPPIANADSATTTINTLVTIDVAANDSDPDGNLNSASTNTTCANGSTGCANPTNGTLINNGDGTFNYTPDLNFNGSDNFVYEICDTDGLCNTSPVSITVNPSAPITVEARVAASSDDAEEKLSSGRVSLTSSDLEMVLENEAQIVGMRFSGLTIPPGATITKAYIQFKVDETNNIDPTLLHLSGEKVINATTFVNSTNNISNRLSTGTSASVDWSPNPWTTRGVQGPDQQTSDITPVIQEIVDQTGWTTGNSLVIIITGEGKRVAESYNGDQAGAPLLHVEYFSGN